MAAPIPQNQVIFYPGVTSGGSYTVQPDGERVLRQSQSGPPTVPGGFLDPALFDPYSDTTPPGVVRDTNTRQPAQRATLVLEIDPYNDAMPPGVIYQPARAPAPPTPTPFNPAQVPELLGGDFWLPGVGVSGLGTAGMQWAGQANGNAFVQATVANQPAAASAPNGAAIWRWDGANDTLRIPTPSVAMRWTTRGMYSGWFKLNVDDANFYTYFVHSTGPANERLSIFHYNAIGLLRSFTNATGATAANQESSRTVNQAVWNYFEWVFDGTGSNNAARWRLFINRQEVAWTYAGTIGAALFAAVAPFDLCSAAGSIPFAGDSGPFYISNGIPSDAHRDGMWQYRAPV